MTPSSDGKGVVLGLKKKQGKISIYRMNFETEVLSVDIHCKNYAPCFNQ